MKMKWNEDDAGCRGKVYEYRIYITYLLAIFIFILVLIATHI